MRKIIVSMAAIIALVGAGAIAWADPPAPKNFGAHLSGDEEVPARDTPAQGQALFKLSKDGTTLSYKLIVANIDNVFAAHIHCAPAGVNGGVGVTLFAGGIPGSGRVQGVLAQGDITAPDNPGGAPCGWTTVQDVVDAIIDGGAYVNVHTNDGVGDPNTGPGDFPGGEIRGQIGVHGPN